MDARKTPRAAEALTPAPRMLVTLPDSRRLTPHVGAVLAHGARSGPEHPFLSLLAAALAARDVIVFRFRFPYRTAGRPSPDPDPVLRRAFYSVAAAARRFLGKGGVLLAGGRSLGARIASLESADTGTWFADGLVLASYPLRPRGQRDPGRIAHWPRLMVPSLFVTGTSDPLVPRPPLVAAQRHLAHAAENVWIAGASHEITESRNDAGRARAEAIADRVVAFADTLSVPVAHAEVVHRGRPREW